MKQALMVLAIGLLGSVLCVTGTHGQAKRHKEQMPIYDDGDGYKVLSVVLNARSEKWKNETIKIDSRTAPPRSVVEIKAQCSGIPPEFQSASEDFDKKVKTRLLLRKRFTLRKKYELVFTSATAGINQPENKEEARKRIRSGTYYVTAVGFDEKRTRAIAFVEYICGSLCGNSLFYYLRESADGWEEAQDVPPKVQSCGQIY